MQTPETDPAPWPVYPKRKCHDCGKPIDNYRCPECWEKYRSLEDMAELSPFDEVVGSL